MPRGNKTGPMGMGMQTGRGAGYCGGMNQPGYATAGGGGRYGAGAGRGRGFRGAGTGRGFGGWSNRPGRDAWWNAIRFGGDAQPYGPPDPEMEKHLLERQAEDLQIELDAIRKRLDDIDSAPSST